MMFKRVFDWTQEPQQERGAVAVTVALLLVGLLSFGALAVDISSLLMVRNELQNAADAGALAATRSLYVWDGTAVDPTCNAVGVATATANKAQNLAVEVVADTENNTGDVQRGHWRWTDHTFTPNDNLEATDLHDATNQELDDDYDFVNAVRVRVRRQSSPARSFLAQVVGLDNFQMQAEAVAYIGYAGSFLPDEADQPIVICDQSLKNSQGEYSCSTGRMINSGGGDTHNSAGWTNFTQQPCETASNSTVRPYVGCSPTPSPEIALQYTVGTTGGQLQSTWDRLFDCWVPSSDTDGDGYPDQVYNMTLPVIDCPGNNVANCSKLIGAVNVNMLWMIRQAANPDFDWVPVRMSGVGPFPDWECPDSITGGSGPADLDESQFRACWLDFVDHFNLVNYAGTSVADFSDSQLNQTMFFVPDCATHVPIGVTAGQNNGVLAKVPVLVK